MSSQRFVMSPRLPGAVRDSALVLLGLVGIVAGGGIGPRYLLAGQPVGGVVGCITLAAGLVAAVVGATHMIRAVPGWWRLLAIPVVLCLLQFLVLPGIGAVMATHVPPTPIAAEVARGVDLTLLPVGLTTADGVTLSAWWIPSATGAVVIARHGSGSNRAAVMGQSEVLARHGFGVLLMDARGHGDSDGQGMDFGWWGSADISAGLDWLATQPSVDPDRIGVLGLSMGAEEAIGAAAADPRIRAVVAEGATARTTADTAYLPHDFEGIVRRVEAAVMYPLADLMTDAPSPIDLRSAAASGSSSILLIASEQAGEVDAARYIQGDSGDRVVVWPVTEGGHTAALDVVPSEWESRVVGFLANALAQ